MGASWPYGESSADGPGILGRVSTRSCRAQRAQMKFHAPRAHRETQTSAERALLHGLRVRGERQRTPPDSGAQSDRTFAELWTGCIPTDPDVPPLVHVHRFAQPPEARPAVTGR